ncbi:MAG: LamG domain-containing protein, partial [Planctomycetota bacterium]
MRRASDSPRLTKGLSVEAWVAPQAYPRNWCAIVNQEEDRKAGYFFGVDAFGHVGLHLAVEGKWYECTSKATVPFMEKWSHIAGTFDKDSGIVVYIDGKVAGTLPVKGSFTFATDVDLQIGRNHQEMMMDPELLVRPRVNFPISYSFDGIIDELKVYERTLSAEQIKQAYQAARPEGGPPLKWRKLPEVASGPSRFGAVYCKLNFYPEWDALWRVHDYPDIVVNFDEGPYKMVFWRGTNYNMNLVTENGKWVGDQSAEEGGGGTIGCCEHMSDKQCRYAHVRIIENHDARVVVHWRYALCDVLYKIARQDKVTDWGAWADEYYYIYPDGVAVRYFQVHGVDDCSITEPAALNNPGQKAEDNLQVEAITTANMAGEVRSHSWDPWPSSGRTGAPFINALPNANISVVNFKSVSKPYYIYEPDRSIIPYGGGTKELRTEYSKFPTWNHWPTSLDPSDGHYPVVADRVTSSAVTSPEPPMKQRGDGSVEGRFVMGLTDKAIEKLAPLARSWLEPPELKNIGNGFHSEGYSRDQRAFLLTKQVREEANLEFELAAGEKSPVVNPAFVIKGWGRSKAELVVNGNEVKRGEDFRLGHRDTLEGGDLVVWVKTEATKRVK